MKSAAAISVVLKNLILLYLAGALVTGRHPFLSEAAVVAPAFSSLLASGGSSGSPPAMHTKHQQAGASKGPNQLIDCERVVASDERPEDTEYCFAIIEAALRSSYGLDMIRSMTKSLSQQQSRAEHPQATIFSQSPHQHFQPKARRDPRSPTLLAPHRAPAGFVPEAFALDQQGGSGDALSKLLLNGLGEQSAGSSGSSGSYGEELSLLDANDKPLWPATMSDGIQSRWQPMRGKRS